MALSAEFDLSKAFVLNRERVWRGGGLLKNPWITRGWDHQEIIKTWSSQVVRDRREGVIARDYTEEEVRDLPRWLATAVSSGVIFSLLAGAATGGPSGAQHITEGPQHLDKVPHGPDGPQIGKVAGVIAFLSLLLSACREYVRTPITKWMEKTAVPTMAPQPPGDYNMDIGHIDTATAHAEIRTGKILTGTLDTAFNEAVQNQVGVNPENVYPVSFRIADDNGNAQNFTLAVETYPASASAKKFFWAADWNPEEAMWTTLGKNNDEESLSRLIPLKWEKLPGPGEHVHFFLEVFENGELVSKDVILLNFDNNTITVIDPLTGVKIVLPKEQVKKSSPLYSLIKADFNLTASSSGEIIPTPSPIIPEGTAIPMLTVTPGTLEPFLISPTSPSPETPEASPTLTATPTEIATLTLEQQLHPGWTEAISETMGCEWSDYIDKTSHFPGDPEGSLPNIYLVSAGSWITDRLPITTKEGEVLATALVSQEGLFCVANELKSVMVPRAIELPSGEVVLYGTRYWFLPENEKVADDIITLHPRAFVRGGFAGSVFSVSLMPDTSLIGGPRDNEAEKILALIDRFNASWKDEMADFIAGGISDIKMLFPWSWGNFEPKTVDLP